MLEKIQKSFIEAFGLKHAEFSLDLSPEKVTAWDSLGHLRLISALQEQFSVEFEIDEIMGMENVEKIIEILNKRELTK